MSKSIPKAWETKKISEIAFVKTGNNKLTKASYVTHGYPAFSGSGQDGYCEHYEHDREAIVIASVGARCGRGYIARGKWTAIANTTIVFPNQQKVDLAYLYANIKDENCWEKSGGAQPFVSVSEIESKVVALPPLAEQKKIAEILSSVDEVIENTESEISKLEDLKKATLNELLTKGIGHTEFKDSEIGRIPKSWRVVPLGDIVKFGGGSAFSESLQGEKQGDFPFIKVSDMNHIENTVWIVHSENWITKSVKEENKIKLFPVDAVVFAKVGAALMLNRRRILSRPTAIDNNMMAAIPHGCDSKFLYWLMCRMDFRRLVQDGAVPSVNQSQLDEIVVALPNASEQRDIAVRLDCLASVIEGKNTVRDAMVSVRAGLMQDLLTGKVRVKVN